MKVWFVSMSPGGPWPVHPSRPCESTANPFLAASALAGTTPVKRSLPQAAYEAVYETILQGGVDTAARCVYEPLKLISDGLFEPGWSKKHKERE